MASTLVFAKLHPINAKAKVAFDDVVKACHSHMSPPAYRRRMHAAQQFQYDVYQERRERIIRDHLLYDDEMDDTSVEEFAAHFNIENEHLGDSWAGSFHFDLMQPPSRPQFGWTYGLDQGSDFVADCEPRPDVKDMHASFDFSPTTGHLFLRARARNVKVNGNALRRGDSFALNQAQMNITFGDLDYKFTYEVLAQGNDYLRRRKVYIDSYLGQHTSDFSLTPTPIGPARTIGRWTLGRPLGKGTFGKVYAATNEKDNLVAVKIVEKSIKTPRQLHTLQDLKRLSDRAKDKHLLRLKEVISQHGDEGSAVFQDIAIVMKPVVRNTLLDFKTDAFKRNWSLESQILALDATVLNIILDTLRGVHFLHAQGYFHGDLKPSNIGVNGTTAIILDLEDCVKLDVGQETTTVAGASGTIGYLAPERELVAHDHTVDMWSLGVIVYELAIGKHPFSCKVNPWRRGEEFEAFRPGFQKAYVQVIEELRAFPRNSIYSLVADMLRYVDPITQQGEPRISAEEALEYACWEALP